MAKNITKRLSDYFFAGDIYDSYRHLENKTRETIIHDESLNKLLKIIKPFKIVDVLFSSVIPNAISGFGIGISLYYEHPGLAFASGLLGEGIRLSSQGSAEESLKKFNKHLDSIMDEINSFIDAETTSKSLYTSDRDNEGE